MELTVDLAKLRETRRVFIATPCYSGQAGTLFLRSCLAAQKLLMECAIPHEFNVMINESLITRARNRLVDLFLQSACTDILFVDSDIEFTPVDIVAMLHHDKEVIGANYPLKSINWEGIKTALANNKDISNEDLAKAGAIHVVHSDNPIDVGYSPVEVKELGTGFLMIKREVFEKIPAESYTPSNKDIGLSSHVKDFFSVGIHENVYESEDYSFCRRYREVGGKIWLCPWIKLTHWGTYGFPGDMMSVAKSVGELH